MNRSKLVLLPMIGIYTAFALMTIAYFMMRSQRTSDRDSVERALRCHTAGIGTVQQCFELEGLEDWLDPNSRKQEGT